MADGQGQARGQGEGRQAQGVQERRRGNLEVPHPKGVVKGKGKVTGYTAGGRVIVTKDDKTEIRPWPSQVKAA